MIKTIFSISLISIFSVSSQACDYTVSNYKSILSGSKAFKGYGHKVNNPTLSCQLARQDAQQQCVNGGFSDCSEVTSAQGDVSSCHAVAYGKKYKQLKLSTSEVKIARCSKLFRCEQDFLNDDKVPVIKLEKLQLIIEKHNCY